MYIYVCVCNMCVCTHPPCETRTVEIHTAILQGGSVARIRELPPDQAFDPSL